MEKLSGYFEADLRTLTNLRSTATHLQRDRDEFAGFAVFPKVAEQCKQALTEYERFFDLFAERYKP